MNSAPAMVTIPGALSRPKIHPNDYEKNGSNRKAVHNTIGEKYFNTIDNDA